MKRSIFDPPVSTNTHAKRPRQPKFNLEEASQLVFDSDKKLDVAVSYPESDLESVVWDEKIENVRLNPLTSTSKNNNNVPLPSVAPPADPNLPRDFSKWDKTFTSGSGIPDFDDSLSGPILFPTGLNHDSAPLDFLSLFLSDDFGLISQSKHNFVLYSTKKISRQATLETA